MPSYTVKQPAFFGGSMKKAGDIVDFPAATDPLPSWVDPKPIGEKTAAQKKSEAAKKAAATKKANAEAKKEQNAATGQGSQDAVSFIEANAADNADGGTASL